MHKYVCLRIIISDFRQAPSMTSYSSADLSNGLEQVAVRAVNHYTYDKIAAFQYIATTEIATGCDEYFMPNEVILYFSE